MTTTDFGFGVGGTVAAEPVNETLPEGFADSVGDFQFDEPEDRSGKFPPRVLPGNAVFEIEVTELREKDNGTAATNKSLHTLANGKVPLIVYTAHLSVATLGSGRLVRPDRDGSLTDVQIRFNEASGYKSVAMAEKHVSSDIERLYAAMGLTTEVGPPKSVDQMVQMIRNAGRRTVSGKVNWSAAIKLPAGGYEVYSTEPNTKRGEKPWPRGTDGKLATEITFSTGDTRVAREAITAVYPVKKRAAKA